MTEGSALVGEGSSPSVAPAKSPVTLDMRDRHSPAGSVGCTANEMSNRMLEAFQTRAGSGVGGETEMRYTGERQRRNDRHGNGACLRRACRRISPLGSM